MVYTIIQRLLKQEWTMQFITFCMVGTLGVVLNYSIFFVLLRALRMHYLLASAAGFTLPIFAVFFLNKRFTFKIRGRGRTGGMLIKYFLVCGFSLLLDQASMAIQVEMLHVDSLLAKIITIGVTTVSNFLGSKFLAFRSV